jgi:hypothetical protein
MYKKQFATWVITNKDRSWFASETEDEHERCSVCETSNILWATEFDTEEAAKTRMSKNWLDCEELGLTKIIQIETTLKELRKRSKPNVSKQ